MVSISTWYLLALPLSAALCFIARLGIFGLWCGLAVGAMTTCVVQWVILSRLDWAGECQKAQARRQEEEQLKAQRAQDEPGLYSS